MCSFVNLENCPEGGYTAEAAILCYKVLLLYSADGSWHSPYFNTLWRSGGVVSAPLGLMPGDVYESYFMSGGCWHVMKDTGDRFDGWHGDVLVENVRKATSGLYAFTRYMNRGMSELVKSLMLAADGFPRVAGLFRCTVPAGSRYYIDEDSEVIIASMMRADAVAGFVGNNSGDPFGGGFEVMPPDVYEKFF